MPGVLAGLNAAHPLVEAQIVTGMNTSLLQLLESGEPDAAIIGKPPRLSSGLAWRAIADEPICVIAGVDLPECDGEALLGKYPLSKLPANQQRRRFDATTRGFGCG